MNEAALSLVGSLLSLLGAFFFLVAGLGLLRLPDVYTRAHAPAKAATLGLMLVALGATLTHGEWSAGEWMEKLLLILFVLLTVPISTQMVVRGAAAREMPELDGTQGQPTKEPIERVD